MFSRAIVATELLCAKALHWCAGAEWTPEAHANFAHLYFRLADAEWHSHRWVASRRHRRVAQWHLSFSRPDDPSPVAVAMAMPVPPPYRVTDARARLAPPPPSRPSSPSALHS